MKGSLLACLLLCGLAAAAAEGSFFVKFEVDKLDGKDGETGSFVMEVAASDSAQHTHAHRRMEACAWN